MVTELDPCVVPKFVPAIVSAVPAGPLVGVRLPMVGRVELPATGVISTKFSLLTLAPGALRIVRRPSETVTVDVPSIHQEVELGAPLTVSTPSTSILVIPSIEVGSPPTTWAV